MKKIALSIMTIGAMFFATQNMQAQDEEMEDVETEVEVEAEQEYTSIDVMELPQAVTEALMTDYNGAVASEAWVKTKGDTKIYKLDIDVKGEKEKVYIDEDGNWLKEDE